MSKSFRGDKETWGGSGRTPEEQRNLEVKRLARSKTKKRREERRTVQEKQANYGVNDLPIVRVPCDRCPYESEDVMWFNDFKHATRMGPMKVRFCPSCQTEVFSGKDKYYDPEQLKVIGPVVEQESFLVRPVTQGVEKRRTLF